MADDIINFGAAERGSGHGHGADAAIESLFHACYLRLVRTGYSLTGDWDLAEQLAQEAHLRLWRRWRWLKDPAAAPMYLQRTVVNASRQSIRRRIIERRVLNAERPEPIAAPAADPDDAVEVRRAVAALPAVSGNASSCGTWSKCRRPRRPRCSASRSAR